MDATLEKSLANYASMIGFAFSEPIIFSDRKKPFDNGDLVLFSALAFALVGAYSEERGFISFEERYTFYRKAANYIIEFVLSKKTGRLIASKEQRILWEPLTKLMSDLSFAGSEARFEDYKGVKLRPDDTIGDDDLDRFLEGEIDEFISIYEAFASATGLNTIDMEQRRLLKREYACIAQAGADDELLTPTFLERCKESANLTVGSG